MFVRVTSREIDIREHPSSLGGRQCRSSQNRSRFISEPVRFPTERNSFCLFPPQSRSNPPDRLLILIDGSNEHSEAMFSNPSLRPARYVRSLKQTAPRQSELLKFHSSLHPSFNCFRPIVSVCFLLSKQMKVGKRRRSLRL